jgi:hypothetical protein
VDTKLIKRLPDAMVVQGLRDLADSYDELDDSKPQYSAAKWAIAYRARQMFATLEETVELGIMMRTLDDRGELAPVRAALAAGNEDEAKQLMFALIG